MNSPAADVRLLASDLEDTLVGQRASEERFRACWESLGAESRPLLVYNTGLNIAHARWLILERRLPAPEFIIGGLGTELEDPVDPQTALEFRAQLTAGWDIAAVERIIEAIPGVQRQSDEFLNPSKSSWHWHRASAAEIARLGGQLAQAGLDVQVSYTGGVFLDVVPRRGGKGHALAWLCQRIGLPLEHVLVAGASANNSSMFALPGVRGIVVSNASRELFAATGALKPFLALAAMADGVLAGLKHFGVIQPQNAEDPRRDLSNVAPNANS
jgi:sucrose-6-phosphatase